MYRQISLGNARPLPVHGITASQVYCMQPFLAAQVIKEFVRLEGWRATALARAGL